MKSVIWTWTSNVGITVRHHHLAEYEAEAREIGAPLFDTNTHPQDLGYFKVEAGRGAHLLWKPDDYRSLYEFSQTEPGDELRDLPSPTAAPVFGS